MFTVFQRANNKGADQTEQMHSLCEIGNAQSGLHFCYLYTTNSGFLATGPIFKITAFKIQFWKVYHQFLRCKFSLKMLFVIVLCITCENVEWIQNILGPAREILVHLAYAQKWPLTLCML